MKRPRDTGVGITEARIVLPGGEDNHVLHEIGSPTQRRVARALHLDHRADFELQAGRHTVAERLAHQAAALREAGR